MATFLSISMNRSCVRRAPTQILPYRGRLGAAVAAFLVATRFAPEDPDALSRARPQGPRIFSQGPGRQTPPPQGLRGPPRRSLLLPEGRHAGLHARGLRLSRRPPGLQEEQ